MKKKIQVIDHSFRTSDWLSLDVALCEIKNTVLYKLLCLGFLLHAAKHSP